VIRSFRDRDTEALYAGRRVRRFEGFRRQAIVRLDRLQAATALNDLAALPGNRLEALAGDRAGQHSIRINDQWRICFRWSEAGADDVEIVDYH
jgi:proteic killer suppression protein